MVANAPTHTSFQILHSGTAFEAKGLSVVLSAPSNTPNQLWSAFPTRDGPWIINRGTGAYLEVENGVALVKIETPYEWIPWMYITSDRIELTLESVSQKQVLQAFPQGIKLCGKADVHTPLNIPYLPNPILSIGSEDYLDSPEHTCVTNHVYNTFHALNWLVEILAHPDKASTTNTMSKLFTSERCELFKARGTEATQNLDFAREVVIAWFTAIGDKILFEVNQKGNLEAAAKAEPLIESGKAVLAEMIKSHVKTEALLKEQPGKCSKADWAYTAAKSQYDTSFAKEQHAIKEYEDALKDKSLWAFGGQDAMNAIEHVMEVAKDQRLGDEGKMNLRKAEREQEEKLLKTLKTQSAKESGDITELEAMSKAIIIDNIPKASELRSHRRRLNILHDSLSQCRTHLADTLEYNLAGGASLTVVRTKLKELVDVLQKGHDFKEPLKGLDRNNLDQLMTRIPAITSHAAA